MARWVEYLIAKRTAQRSGVGSNMGVAPSVEGGASTYIATLAVALSLVVMILTLSVVGGSKRFTPVSLHSQGISY